MIPKVIHYCWFGKNKKSEIIKKCIKSWDRLSEYKIVEWNEDNIDISENQYLKEAFNRKMWAFVSDYIRLKVLYEYGGIYLDTDVEIKKNFSDDFLNNDLFLSFMYNCNLSTAIIGSSKYNNTIKELLDLYDNKELKVAPNNDLFTSYFLENYSSFKLNNKYQVLDKKITIYPKEYFECPTLNKKYGYSIHHFEASWKEKNNWKKVIKSLLPVYIYQNIIRYRAIKKSPFYSIYIKNKYVRKVKICYVH